MEEDRRNIPLTVLLSLIGVVEDIIIVVGSCEDENKELDATGRHSKVRLDSLKMMHRFFGPPDRPCCERLGHSD